MRKTHRLPPTNINFRTTASLKAECERAVKKHPDMDGVMTTFFEDCMKQFVVQMRNPGRTPVYPLEFVAKKETEKL